MIVGRDSVASTDVGERGRNVFLVSTPIQLLFADMIAQQRGMRAEYYLTTGYTPNVDQIRRLSADLGLPSCRQVVPFGYGNTDQFLQLIHNVWLWAYLVALKRSCTPSDRVFLGIASKAEYRPLISTRSRFRTAYYDEGTASISLLVHRSQGACEIQFPSPRLMSFFTVFYPRAVMAEKLSYFTVYPGLAGAPGDSIALIEPRLPKTLRRTKRVVPEVWYIGGPLVQAQLISKESELKLLSDLREVSLSRGLELVHYRHRSEAIRPDSPEVEIRSTDLPFEVYFGLSDFKPLAVVSVISSVIIHMRLFFGGECGLYYLNPDDVHDPRRIGIVQGYAAAHLGLLSLSVPEFAARLDLASDYDA